MLGDILIPCKMMSNNKEETWQASLKQLNNYNNYYEATIEARSTHFDMLVGLTDTYYWVALPIQEIACSLSNPLDIFWNEEHLSRLVGVVDAITIATCIKFIEVNKDILLNDSLIKTNY